MTLKGNTQFRNLSDSGLKTLVPSLFGVEMPGFEAVTAGKHFDELDPKPLMENSEELSFSETVNMVEDLRDTEESSDCFNEGEFDEKNVVSRVKLF